MFIWKIEMIITEDQNDDNTIIDLKISINKFLFIYLILHMYNIFKNILFLFLNYFYKTKLFCCHSFLLNIKN
jgi:hypothetical protein